MDLILIRHGESEANKLGLVCGQLDSPLTELGVRQAEALRKKMDALKMPCADNIYVSHLKRAIHTAELVFPDAKFIVQPEIAETDTGIYSEITVEELLCIEPRFERHGEYKDLAYPDGESISDLYKRIILWFDKNIISLLPKMHDDVVAIVGHGGTVNCILHFLLKNSLNNYPAFGIRNASCTRIELNSRSNVNVVDYDVVGY